MSNRNLNSASEPCDLQLLLDSQLAQKLISGVAFPLEVKFLEFDQSDKPDTSGDGPPELDADFTEAVDDSQLEEVLDDVGLRPAVDELLDRHEVSDVDDLLDTIAGDAADHVEVKLDRQPADAAAQEDGVGEEEQSAPQHLPAKKRSRVEVLGLALTVVSAPDVQVGNPVVLSNLTVKVRAKLRVHVQLFGRWCSFPLRIPQMTFQGQQATLNLSAGGSVIYAAPELQELNLTASVTLFKKPMRLKLSVSKFVNRQLARRKPLQVVDLGMMSRGLSIGTEHPEVHVVALDNRPEGLLVKLNFELHEAIKPVLDDRAASPGEVSPEQVDVARE